MALLYCSRQSTLTVARNSAFSATNACPIANGLSGTPNARWRIDKAVGARRQAGGRTSREAAGSGQSGKLCLLRPYGCADSLFADGWVPSKLAAELAGLSHRWLNITASKRKTFAKHAGQRCGAFADDIARHFAFDNFCSVSAFTHDTGDCALVGGHICVVRVHIIHLPRLAVLRDVAAVWVLL